MNTDAAEIAEQKAILRGHMLEIRAEAAARDPDAADKLALRFPVKLFERYGPVVAGTMELANVLKCIRLFKLLRACVLKVPWSSRSSPMSLKNTTGLLWQRAFWFTTEMSSMRFKERFEKLKDVPSLFMTKPVQLKSADVASAAPWSIRQCA
jgi:hypothetical protein